MLITVRNSRDFGALMRERRRALGWSQQALADAIGASRLWVNQVERGKPRAELGRVLRALDLLGVDLRAGDRSAPSGAADINAIVERAGKRRP
jgi:HTH-type transcriptional regulator/antitoxin HipB